ncbi:MAG TPA: carbamoyltransferase C-terminal domain-containing protein [Candidatus Angelobacter sp.]|nr:carbamoyltransferase C-terminal domain-containing protein [Candidatus Angelobacter sp.]
MLVLGWHGNSRWREGDEVSGYSFHDAAAVLIRNGAVVAAIEEERLNRIKHSNVFPARAIRYCLAYAGVTLEDLDAIVTDSSEDFYEFLTLHELVHDPRLARLSGRELIAAAFRREFGADVSGKLRFCKHHFAHLCSAWYPSGFSEALVVCLDGDGDGLSGLIAHCRGDQIKILRNLPEAYSLGNFYTAQIGVLGYQRFDEYKVMGLAPYGNPKTFAPLFRRMFDLQPEGRFTIVSDAQRISLLKQAGLTSHFRAKGEPFTQVHKDFAAALQATLECIASHVVNWFQKQTGARYLCLSGGVAHNCTLNGVLLRSGAFKQIYVQPAAHDAGNALGAALATVREAGASIARPTLPHLFLGPNIGTDEDSERELRRWQPLLDIERVENASEIAAELLAQGMVISWVQGRSEFGPRALGNRSILADPRPAENKHIINAMVKKREAYRPFAPSVLEERLRDYFEVPEGTERVPFMIIVLPVRAEMRELLGAVTHVDGSARVQSVSRSDNPSYHALIEAFGRRTGVPIVLNTSANNNAEPIIDSVRDAIVMFLTTGIQALLLGDWLVRKVDQPAHHPAFLDLVPDLPLTRKLVRRTTGDGQPAYCIESTAPRYFGTTSWTLSAELAPVLLHDDGSRLRERFHTLGMDNPSMRGRLAEEVFALWVERALRLSPCER